MRAANASLLARGLRLAIVLAGAAGAASAAGARVVLVGVDGASWNVIDPMLERGELPAWAALARRGVTARLKSVKPLNSPAVWTSLATGRSPRVHGVTDFDASRLSVRVPTLFERLAAAGRRVGLYDYLVTWPPRALPGGFVVPGWLRHDDRVEPADLWQRIGATPYAHGYDAERTPDEFLELAHRELREKPVRWRRLWRSFDLDVGAVCFYAVDLTSHRFWHAAFPEDFDEALPPAPERQRTAIADALRGVDRALAEIAATLAPEDTLLVVSDHGFRAEPRVTPIWVTRLEPLLERQGLEPGRDGFSVVTTFGIVVLHVHEGPFAEREAVLERLVAPLETARSADGERLFAVDVVDLAPRPRAARRPALRRLRQWGVQLVARHVFGLNTDRPGHAYVFARPREAALARLWPDASLRIAGAELRASEAFERDAFSGAHDREGVFLAAGGPIAPLEKRLRLSLLDVAPLLLYLAGAPLPDDLEGRLPEALLAPEALRRQPPRRVPAALLPGLGAPLAEIEAEGDPALLETLRALGYVR